MNKSSIKIFLLIIHLLIQFQLPAQDLFEFHSSRDKTNLLEVIIVNSKYFVLYQDSTFFDKRIKCKVFSNTNPTEQKEFYLTPALSTFQDELKYQIISNNFIFFSFIDFRDDANGDIYSQLIDENGILWDSGGIPICREIGMQNNVSISADTMNNIFVVWEDYRSDQDGDIFIQKLNLFGKNIWKNNGIVVSNLKGMESSPQVTIDNAGGCYVSWVEKILHINKLYIQRLDENGKKKFGEFGIFISNPEESCQDNLLVTDGYNELIVFYSGLKKNKKIFFQKITKNGVKKLGLYGKELCSKQGNQELIDVKNFINNNLVVLFTHEEKENFPITYLQIFAKDGKSRFKNPIKISSNCNFHQKPKLSIYNNGFFIYWTCYLQNKDKVSLFIQTISSRGEMLKADGFRIGDDLFDPISRFYVNLGNPLESVISNYKKGNNIVFLYLDISDYKNPKVQNFSASYYEGLVKISWDILNDRPGTKISLQRKIGNNGSWKEIYVYNSNSRSFKKQLNFDDQILFSENLKYRIICTDPEGIEIITDEIEINTETSPKDFYLFQNSPNPFSKSTKIAFRIPLQSLVTIKIYNSRLEEIGTIINDVFQPGTHEIEFIPFESMESGIYFYRIFTTNFYDVKKMIYTK